MVDTSRTIAVSRQVEPPLTVRPVECDQRAWLGPLSAARKSECPRLERMLISSPTTHADRRGAERILQHELQPMIQATARLASRP